MDINQLIQDGIVEEIQGNPDSVIFNIPIQIKKQAISENCFELFAGRYGWKAAIEAGGVAVQNEEDSPTACKRIVYAFVREVFESVLIEKEVEEAKIRAALLTEALT
jgi:hypothetical protein